MSSAIYVTIFISVIALVLVWYISTRIHEKYLEDDVMLVKLRTKLEPVFPEINNVILLRGKKSYTINKKRIHLCLYDKDGKYYDENMLTYVTIHELAHVKCPEIGHTDKFHAIFTSLLDQATKAGVYNPNKPIIRDYCMYND